MRVINFNIKGAPAPGRMDRKTQERSWHLLAAYGADLALVQEAEIKAIPVWARERWSVVTGEPSLLGDINFGWGSAIVANKGLKLRARNDLLDQKWANLLYDYAVFGEIELPDNSPALVVTVHAPATKLQNYLKCVHKSGALSPDEIRSIAQPGDDAWAIDLFFAAIAPIVKDRRFIVGGDWNNSRLFDLDPKLRKRGQPPFAAMFFTRARDARWFECHGSKNEEQSFFHAQRLPHQLDHLFCDNKTAKKLKDCSVRADWIVPELSDHAPMLTDFQWS